MRTPSKLPPIPPPTAACAPELPVFVATGGERDIVDGAAWQGLPPTVKRQTFASSGHLPFVEQRDELLVALLEFFDAADGVTTNREFKFAPLDKTLRELTSS